MSHIDGYTIHGSVLTIIDNISISDTLIKLIDNKHITKVIINSANFNQKLSQLPDSITDLHITHNTQLLSYENIVDLPQNLKKLCIETDYEDNDIPINYPSSLKTLAQFYPCNLKKLPSSLQKLILFDVVFHHDDPESSNKENNTTFNLEELSHELKSKLKKITLVTDYKSTQKYYDIENYMEFTF